MKIYVLKSELKVTDDLIRTAHRWEKRRTLKYGEDIAHLLLDYLLENGDEHGNAEIENVEIEEVSPKEKYYWKD